jgi:septum formation topological specificity factor MinE
MTVREFRRSHPRLIISLLIVLPVALVLAPLTVVGQSQKPAPSASPAGPSVTDTSKLTKKDPFGKLPFGTPGMERDGAGRGPGPKQPLTDEQIKQTVDVLVEIQPELGRQLEALGQKDPEQLRQQVAKLSPRLKWLVYQKSHDPEGYAVRVEEQRLQLQAADLAHKIREADPKMAAQLKSELHSVLEKHFEARNKVVEHELISLEKRIQRLRDDLKMQRDQKDQIIDERMEQLLSQPVSQGSSTPDPLRVLLSSMDDPAFKKKSKPDPITR